MARTLSQWFDLTRSATSGLTDEEVGAVAGMCFAQDAGDGSAQKGVWHNTAVIKGYVDRCNCAPCAKMRGKPQNGAFRYHDLSDRRVSQ